MTGFIQQSNFRNPCLKQEILNITKEFYPDIEMPNYKPSRESNCCGAKVEYDSDICSDCKEHCTVTETCDACQGEGKVDVLDDSKELSRYTTPPTKTVTCEKCNGEGYIEE